ncbi:MAG: hypothetical protein ACK5NU_12905 [Fusobacterium ulcerans]|uniref:hypothetical protein n=1 Tax=Fusobacterium ulcerans TaxID=861 RepID=UPI003A8634FA
MLSIFKILERLYSEYEKTNYLNVKLNLIKKIDILEKEILKNIIFEKINIINYIINNYNKKTEFICSRYLFFLNEIDIPEEYTEKVIEIYLKIIFKFKFEIIRKDLVFYAIKGLGKFYFKNFEEIVIELSKDKIFSLYRREFIILLGKTKSSLKSINLLIELIKKYQEVEDEIYWSIGMITSYKRYPFIKRKLLNNYLKFQVKILKNTTKKVNLLSYFLLIEIFFIPNGIDGKIFNDILELLYENLSKNILKEILIKVMNNNEVSLEEKNIILNIEKKF